MAESLTSINVLARLKATLQNTVDGNTVSADLGKDFRPGTTLVTGTTANQADRYWQDADIAIGSGANVDIDLFDFGSRDIGAGAGRDPLGQANTWAELVALLIVCESTSAGTLEIGGEGSTASFAALFGASDTAKTSVGAGGFVMWFNPVDPAYAIADTSDHLLRLAASGGDVDASIYAIGRSA